MSRKVGRLAASYGYTTWDSVPGRTAVPTAKRMWPQAAQSTSGSGLSDPISNASPIRFGTLSHPYLRLPLVVG